MLKGLVAPALLFMVLLSTGCVDIFSWPQRPELCYKVTDANYKDLCLHKAAVKKGDPSFCEQIKNVKTRDNCLVNLSEGLKWDYRYDYELSPRENAVACRPID